MQADGCASVRIELMSSLIAGYIDHRENALEIYRPKLLTNDIDRGQKVLTSIVKELQLCKEFYFSVAFVTESGVVVLQQAMESLMDKGIKGKIVASQYLNFTEPKALRRLLHFTNIELRILTDQKMHAKGYLFKHSHMMNLIVGSSNLTQEALGNNREWNLKVSSLEEGSIVQDTLSEFNRIFQQAVPVTNEWIDAYENIYRQARRIYSENDLSEGGLLNEEGSAFKSTREENYRISPLLILDRIVPNKMQVKALQGIERIRKAGQSKALLISATGTGKTYLAGFDVQIYRPQKCLFLAHREQILNQSLVSFRRILGQEVTFGKFTGTHREPNAQVVFSTVQTMSKEDSLLSFSRDHFDYIIIDETHRAGAESYQKILKHFTPSFLLGMTATPERMDGYNIFRDFDYQVAYEIRLQEALREEMLCPFHYFGVSEILVNGTVLDDKSQFIHLVSEERVRNILEKANMYGFHGERVKGLVFCSRNDEAKELSVLFCQKGYKTLALSGADDQSSREDAIIRLEQDEIDDRLDYIFTVDIFNEGVDIPKVNQILMLRPTQSAIVFVQQLGRGLRKSVGKNFVIVLDFIGNYERNFMIPVALSDDRSFNKDTIRRYVAEGSKVIPGCSTVNFDAISKKRIYDSLDQVSNKDINRLIRDSYQILKYRLGRIPRLMDYEEHDSVDVVLLFARFGSYHDFLLKNEKNSYKVIFNELQVKYLNFISIKLANGKRPHELLVLQAILEGRYCLLEELQKRILLCSSIRIQPKTLTNVVNVLTNEFPAGSGKGTYQDCILIEQSGNDYRVSQSFSECLANPAFRQDIEELVLFGMFRYAKYYGNSYQSTSFQLNQKYSYEDVCRLLEWEHNEVPLNIGGYKYDTKSKTFPVFINYNKDEGITNSIKYEDRFESPSTLIALSKSRRTVDSSDIRTIYQAEELGVEIHLFVRKDKNDEVSKEFYYFGRIYATDGPFPIKMLGEIDAVEIVYRLDTAVRDDLYEYITEIQGDREMAIPKASIIANRSLSPKH